MQSPSEMLYVHRVAVDTETPVSVLFVRKGELHGRGFDHHSQVRQLVCGRQMRLLPVDRKAEADQHDCVGAWLSAAEPLGEFVPSPVNRRDK